VLQKTRSETVLALSCPQKLSTRIWSLSRKGIGIKWKSIQSNPVVESHCSFEWFGYGNFRVGESEMM
jgi:hypothetical protein